MAATDRKIQVSRGLCKVCFSSHSFQASFFLSCLWTLSQLKEWCWIVMRCFLQPCTMIAWSFQPAWDSSNVFFFLLSKEVPYYLGHCVDTYGYQRGKVFQFSPFFFFPPISFGVISQVLCFLSKKKTQLHMTEKRVGLIPVCRAKGEVDEWIWNWCEGKFPWKHVSYIVHIGIPSCLINLPFSCLFHSLFLTHIHLERNNPCYSEETSSWPEIALGCSPFLTSKQFMSERVKVPATHKIAAYLKTKSTPYWKWWYLKHTQVKLI